MSKRATLPRQLLTDSCDAFLRLLSAPRSQLRALPINRQTLNYEVLAARNYQISRRDLKLARCPRSLAPTLVTNASPVRQSDGLVPWRARTPSMLATA